MASVLSYNPANGRFVYRARTRKAYERAHNELLFVYADAMDRSGVWTLSTDSSYAALCLWDQADDAARAQLRKLKDERDRSFQTTTSVGFPVPSGRELRPYQRAGVAYALGRRACLFGDEPGLGKTAQAIVVGNQLDAHRILVVCPASVRLHWQREIRSWSTLRRPIIDVVDKGGRAPSPLAHWVVTSYDLLRANLKSYAQNEWDLLILDEAHFLKSQAAKRTQAVFGSEGVAKRARRIIALTGTPLPNRPRECYTLARGLCWDAIDWASYEKFCERYNPSARMPSGWVREETGRLAELQNRLRCEFMVRRLKKDVLTDLPAKTYELTYVEENGAIRRVLEAEALLDVDLDDLEHMDAETMGHIATLRREMGEAKVPRVLEHLHTLLDSGAPALVVFAHHRSVIEGLVNGLKKPYKAARLWGGMTPRQKEVAIQEFLGSSAQVIVCQLDVGGVGIDGFQRVASHVVIAEPDWVFGRNEQAVDRLHRIGQKDAVLAQFLVAPGSLDEKVLGRAIGKGQNVHLALDAEMV